MVPPPSGERFIWVMKPFLPNCSKWARTALLAAGMLPAWAIFPPRSSPAAAGPGAVTVVLAHPVSNVSAAALAAILMARLDGQDEIPIFTSILHGAVRV